MKRLLVTVFMVFASSSALAGTVVTQDNHVFEVDSVSTANKGADFLVTYFTSMGRGTMRTTCRISRLAFKNELGEFQALELIKQLTEGNLMLLVGGVDSNSLGEHACILSRIRTPSKLFFSLQK